MSTVGFGDVFAKSHCGRVIAIITAFWGIFFVSLFVLSLIKIFEHDSSEKKAYKLMVRLKQKDELKQISVNLIGVCYKIKRIE
jgi:hypothetical protein